MTLRIPRAHITDEAAFATGVEKFIAQLKAHAFTVGKAAPIPPHPLIELAIKRVDCGPRQPAGYVADYEIYGEAASCPGPK